MIDFMASCSMANCVLDLEKELIYRRFSQFRYGIHVGFHLLSVPSVPIGF